MKRHLPAFASTLLLIAASSTSVPAEQRTLTRDPQSTKVSFDLPATGHDVHGLLTLQSGAVRFDPETGEAAGEIVLDATSAETGSGSRDRTMHEKVLESVLFPRFVFRPTRFTGDLTASEDVEITLSGTLDVHGETRPLTLPGSVRLEGEHLTGTVRFPIPFVEWGMHDPSLLMLRVAKVVEVDVELDGTVTAPTTLTRLDLPHNTPSAQ